MSDRTRFALYILGLTLLSPSVWAQPLLGLSQSNGVWSLVWPKRGTGFQLQRKDGLGDSAAWSNVATTSVGGDPIHPEGRMAFYRLSAPRKLHHVLITGQSLAIGAYASDILSPAQPFQNRMFAGQRLDGGQSGLELDDLSALVPLVETWTPQQFTGETIASGFANFVASQVEPDTHDLLVSNCGRASASYVALQRVPSGIHPSQVTGTTPYLRGLSQIAAAKANLGSAVEFTAVLAVHGETDWYNPQYDDAIRHWQYDYEADVHELTGQTNRIPMFHSQSSAWSERSGFAGRAWSPFKTLEAAETDPDRIVLVCPKYMLPYLPDGVHLTSEGNRWLGEYYGKAYLQHVIQGKRWSPLRPAKITRQGNVITIVFAGVVGALTADTRQVPSPGGWTNDRTGSPTGAFAVVRVDPLGFEYWDEVGSGIPWSCSTFVTGVEIIATNAVNVTLNQPPQGVYRRIRYAFTPARLTEPGATDPFMRARGCLRDTDPTPSLYGNTLFNWCVHFDKPCP